MKRVGCLASVAWLVFALARLSFGAEVSHNFARWENEIATFEQMDRTNPPPKGGVLFIGSSTIRLWTNLTADFPHQPVINRGFGGSEIADSTHFADRIIFPYEPRMVFLRAGGNDLFAGKSAIQVFKDFQQFVATVHARLPATQIIFISLAPTIARWQQASKEKALNSMVESFALRTPGVKYIETYQMSLGHDGKPRPDIFRADKLHFNAEGYKLLAELVRPYLPKEP